MENSRRKSSQSEQDKSHPLSNQKKRASSSQNNASRNRKQSSNNESSTSKKHNLFKQSLYLGSDYMKTFIKKHTKDSFKCLKCKDDILKKTGREFMWCENLYSHITSESHKDNTPQNEQNKLKGLIEKINKKYSNKKIAGNLQEDDNDDENVQDRNTIKYLQFIAFTVSQRLSFSQISQIGKFIQNLAKEDQLDFFLTHYFDEEVISKTISQCFRPALKENILDNLMNSRYSLSLDTATMVGQSLCLIRARYLQENYEENKVSEDLVDRIVGITTLKESSTGEVMHNILKDKVFVENDIIKRNLIGLTHDNISSLAGEGIGLVGLIRKESENYVFDLADPCHCISLALKHSLQELPDRVMEFVEGIHTFFAYPQRKAKLNRIQEELSRPKLHLKKYVSTRWLSLGQSLQRLLHIWDSLTEYMVRKNQETQDKEKN